jgi:hypothetical protein
MMKMIRWIYKICTYLDIDYDIDIEDDKIIEGKIESIKIGFF